MSKFKITAAYLIVISALVLAACGQKGPLFMPKDSASQVINAEKTPTNEIKKAKGKKKL